MPLHIGEVNSEVQIESSGTGGGGAGSDEEIWKKLAQQRALQERMLDDCARTLAIGNED